MEGLGLKRGLLREAAKEKGEMGNGERGLDNGKGEAIGKKNVRSRREKLSRLSHVT